MEVEKTAAFFIYHALYLDPKLTTLMFKSSLVYNKFINTSGFKGFELLTQNRCTKFHMPNYCINLQTNIICIYYLNKQNTKKNIHTKLENISLLLFRVLWSPLLFLIYCIHGQYSITLYKTAIVISLMSRQMIGSDSYKFSGLF